MTAFLLLFFFLSFVHLSTHKEGDTSDSKRWLTVTHNFHEKCILQNGFCKVFARYHGILTKLSSLIHLYSSFLQFPNNKATFN